MLDLKEKREQAHLTQQQLANQIGIARQAISKFELGTARPTVENAKAIAKILQFDWTEFYEKANCG